MPTASVHPAASTWLLSGVVHHFDTDLRWQELQGQKGTAAGDFGRLLPFYLLHLSVLAIPVVGWSPVAVAVAVAFYALRMFAITAFFHRYFSHRAFRTSRIVQFLAAVVGNMAAQRGPLWWAAHHRAHHRHSDGADDVHSPVSGSLWHSHIGWIGEAGNFGTDYDRVADFAAYPELRWLNRFDLLVPLMTGIAFFWLGLILEMSAPHLGTGPWQMFLWGFVLSTLALYHATFTINSLAHRWGSRPYDTKDDSRNNALLALFTFGEGWHNNHHRFPSSVRQGFRWWQYDPTWYGLLLLERLGLVWDLRPVPASIVAEGRAS